MHSSTFLIGDTQVLNLVFLATDFTGEPWIRSPEEVSGIVWIDPGEQEGPVPIPPWTADSIRKAVERYTKIYF